MKTLTSFSIYFVFLFCCLFSLLGQANAGTNHDYGPRGHRFGLGVTLGEPTGITAKGYLSPVLALKGALGYSINEEHLSLTGDATWDLLDLPIEAKKVSFPFYAGTGFFWNADSNKNDENQFGVHFPVGVAAHLAKGALEFFVELTPGLALIPSTDFVMGGGIGGRFYF